METNKNIDIFRCRRIFNGIFVYIRSLLFVKFKAKG